MYNHQNIKTQIHTTFSCICYLRNLYTEDCFINDVINGIPIKQLIYNEKTSDLYNLINCGIYETVQLNYLMGFSIYLYCGDILMEAYTFDIKCGDIHKSGYDGSYDVNRIKGCKMSNDSKNGNINIINDNYIKLLKKFCLMIQKLNPLPPNRHLCIKLIYTDDTPIEYQPSGFVDGNILVEGTTLEYGVSDGVVPSSVFINKIEMDGNGCNKENFKSRINGGYDKENIERCVNNGCDKENSIYINNNSNSIFVNNSIKPNININNSLDTSNQVKCSDTFNSISSIEYKETINNVSNKNLNNDRILNCTDKKKNEISNKNNETNNKNKNKRINNRKKGTNNRNTIINNRNKVPLNKDTTAIIKDSSIINSNTNKPNDSIRCTCQVNSPLFDLIYCDTCSNWLHTVCCGYFSNKDKRIPKQDYKCLYCIENCGNITRSKENNCNININNINKNNNKTINNISYDSNKMKIFHLSNKRRFLSILFNEPTKTKRQLSLRMELDFKTLDLYLDEFIKEGLIQKIKKGRIIYYECVMDEKNKKKLKMYFRLEKSSINIDKING